MKMISQMLLCNSCKSHIPRLCTPDKRHLDFKCPNCGAVGKLGAIMEGAARESGSETKKQRDKVQGLIRDNLHQEVDKLGHTIDLSKGINKGEALIRPTMHQASVENEVRQFNEQMKGTPTPVGSNGWNQTFARNGFPDTNGLLANARAQYAGEQNPMQMLHAKLGKR